MTSVAIMQPTYLPWIGYFGLMDAVDVFVILDIVQFDRRSWQQRNRIKTATGSMWLTVPVISKGQRSQSILETKIDTNQKFPLSHCRSISQNYSKSSNFKEYWPDIENIINSKHDYLSHLTVSLISLIKNRLAISTELILASNLSVSGNKDVLLLNICEEVGAKVYISPPGSESYLGSENCFDGSEVSLKYFSFEHPEYRQLFESFMPYMSIIDLLFNTGKASVEVIRSGVR